MNTRLSNEGVMIQLIEEMAELTQVLGKELRISTPGTFAIRVAKEEVREHLVEEVADVEMMLQALKKRMGTEFQLQVEFQKEEKLLTRQALYDELT